MQFVSVQSHFFVQIVCNLCSIRVSMLLCDCVIIFWVEIVFSPMLSLPLLVDLAAAVLGFIMYFIYDVDSYVQ